MEIVFGERGEGPGEWRWDEYRELRPHRAIPSSQMKAFSREKMKKAKGKQYKSPEKLDRILRSKWREVGGKEKEE